MTGAQYQGAIAALGLSQRASAAFPGVDERTVRRWIADAAPIPQAVAMLLGLMINPAHKISVEGAAAAGRW